MDDIDIRNESDRISVNATQIISKYRNIKDRLNFCFEKNWYHPNEVGFDANFFLKVIMGEKKYLPNNFTVNYKMHYFRKGEKLDKDYIIQKMKKNPLYAKYTPDIKDPKKFSKDFLLLLIAYIEPNLYKEIYSINKRQLSERIFNKWGDYKIDVQKSLVKDIEQFTSINPNKNSRGGFRTTKNHSSAGTFYKFRNNEGNQYANDNNKNIYFQQQIQQLNQINQEGNQKNEKLLMENNNLVLKLQEMEKKLKINDEKIQKYENIIASKIEAKGNEDIEMSGGDGRNINSNIKVLKIKTYETGNRGKK